MSFKDLGLNEKLLQNLEKLGYKDPTPIQKEAIPIILEKKDVAGLAQTGTGKTAAFLLPMIERIMASISGTNPDLAFEQWGKQNFCLILVPTRELAEQVSQNIKDLGSGQMQSAVVIGGKEYDEQIKKIESGVDFIVATPGRLIDLYKEKKVDLSLVKAVIFDEADRMFDMGFKDDMVYLLQRVPADRQLLMFSATMNFDVLNVAYEFGSEPYEINIDRDQARAENVADEIFHVGQDEKPKYLLSILQKENPSQGIIFSNFKRNIPKLEKFLIENSYKSQGISSSLNQNQRQRVMNQFKNGELQLLIATDVAARGLDIKGVDLVINFELPDDPENYVHRIGRTGRAGEKGRACSLVSDKDIPALNRIEDYVGNKIEIGWLEDEHLAKDFKAYPQGYDSESNFERVQKKSYNDRLQDDRYSTGSGKKSFDKRNSKKKGKKFQPQDSQEFKKTSEPKSFKAKKEFKKRPDDFKNSKKSKFKNKNTDRKKSGDRYQNFKTLKRTGAQTATASKNQGGLITSIKKWFGL